VDRSFVWPCSIDEAAHRPHHRRPGHDLGHGSLAEGVDDPRSDEQLALGCQMVQGYLYAKPMPIEAFITWFRAGQA
jgi:EAL domain-containing protein (putative c-di-GMP-specific phosphodiesterase class I)